MAALILTRHALHRVEMYYKKQFGRTIRRVQHIFLMSRNEIGYTTCHLKTQTVAPTLTGFQDIKCCVRYMASHPPKPIFFPSDSYDGSNVVILMWSGNQVEY